MAGTQHRGLLPGPGVDGRGSWNPGNDSGLWVKFSLQAHHLQAQTLQRRFREAEAIWTAIDALIAEHGLPARLRA